MGFFFQAVHQELEQSLQEQETLKMQIGDYMAQVARFEGLLAQKVKFLSIH